MEIRIKKNQGQEPYVEQSLEKIMIGSLCSSCTNPTEKVMQSYVFDLDTIIGLGMYEKAQIATEVLIEQGGDPLKIAEEKLLPLVKKATAEFEAGRLDKIQLVKSLQAAQIAVQVLRKEAGADWKKREPDEDKKGLSEELTNWDEFLRKTVHKYCGFLLP